MNETEQLLIQLMQDHGNALKRTAFVMVGDLQTSEDLTQETFIQFYKNQHRFRGESSYKTFLYSILINQIKMHRRLKIPTPSALETSLIRNEEISLEDRLIKAIDLNKALFLLKDRYRDPIVLYYYNGLSLEDIGTTLNISLSATKMRLSRGRQLLKEILEKGDYS